MRTPYLFDENDGWVKKFAFLPKFISDHDGKTVLIWLERYEERDAGFHFFHRRMPGSRYVYEYLASEA